MFGRVKNPQLVHETFFPCHGVTLSIVWLAAGDHASTSGACPAENSSSPAKQDYNERILSSLLPPLPDGSARRLKCTREMDEEDDDVIVIEKPKSKETPNKQNQIYYGLSVSLYVATGQR